jgi:hypothetical protein
VRNYCILRGPGGEHILDIVPRGTELGTQVKTGSRADPSHTLSNPQVECTGVLLCVIRELLQLQVNCISDNSRQWGSSLQLALTDRPASFSIAQSLFEIHNRPQLEHKAATVTCIDPHIARAINI